jgi:MerR family transcriptional regulator, light-induced transcriptional regulator
MASAFGAGSGRPRPNFQGSGERAGPSPSFQNVRPRMKGAMVPSPDGAEEQVDHLIEREILPRLLVAHQYDGNFSRRVRLVENTANISQEEANAFAPLALDLDANDLMAEVERFLVRGISAEDIFIQLLAPAARKLGEYWEEDRCDFVDVTMGLWRLQEVMREIAQRSPAFPEGYESSRSVLFSPMPGEQHCFGTLMVEEVFARAGWDSEALLEPQRSELLRVLSDREFELVGLTVSNDCPSGELASLVTAIRSVSKCRSVKVIIGGRVINADPSLADRAGADGTAMDASSALILADRIVPVSKRNFSFGP